MRIPACNILLLLLRFNHLTASVSVSSAGVYKAAEARLLLLMYKVNYVSQGTQPKEAAVTPAKIIEDSWTMDGFVSFTTWKDVGELQFVSLHGQF